MTEPNCSLTYASLSVHFMVNCALEGFHQQQKIWALAVVIEYKTGVTYMCTNIYTHMHTYNAFLVVHTCTGIEFSCTCTIEEVYRCNRPHYLFPILEHLETEVFDFKSFSNEMIISKVSHTSIASMAYSIQPKAWSTSYD